MSNPAEMLGRMRTGKVSIEFSNKEVIIDFGQRGFQGVIRSGSQIAVGSRSEWEERKSGLSIKENQDMGR